MTAGESSLGCRILVLGLGNVLWADEAFGVRAVEALAARRDWPPHVRLVDGGTQGLYLLPHIQACRALLILDAVDLGLTPGTLVIRHDDEVPRTLSSAKLSLHQTTFQEVLALAVLTGQLPRPLTLIGVQIGRLDDFGGPLSPPVTASFKNAVAAAADWLNAWLAQDCGSIGSDLVPYMDVCTPPVPSVGSFVLPLAGQKPSG